MSSRRPDRALLGAGFWVALVVGARAWGHRLVGQRPEMRITAAPLVGSWIPIHTLRTLVPIAVALAVVASCRWAVARMGWRSLVGVTALVAVGWLLALNHIDAEPGRDPLRDPLSTRYEYAAGLPDVGAAGGAHAYLRTFTERIDGYPTHVRGHPPGMVLVLWWGEGLGVDPLDAALGLALAGWAVAVAAALVALADVAGEETARRVAPFLALAPAAIWAGTSLDAFFAAVTVGGTALFVLATGSTGRKADVLAVGSGIVLGGALLLSYGTAPALLIPVVIAAVRRRPRALVITGAAAAAVLLIAASAGFWWLDGLHTTRTQYEKGLASVRPYSYWVIGNLAAMAIATGPAVAGGLAHLAGRLRQSMLGLAAFAAILLADISGLSKGEVERIWLPFAPWLISLVGLLPARSDGPDRRWLAAQATVAIVVQVWLRSPW